MVYLCSLVFLWNSRVIRVVLERKDRLGKTLLRRQLRTLKV